MLLEDVTTHSISRAARASGIGTADTAMAVPVFEGKKWHWRISTYAHVAFIVAWDIQRYDDVTRSPACFFFLGFGHPKPR